MLRNYLKIALRNLRRQRGYTAINVAGLAVGLAGCMLIASYVRYELSYDDFHTHADRTYRVTRVATYPEEAREFANTPAAVGPTLRDDLPNVEASVRIMKVPFPSSLFIETGDRQFAESGFRWTDSTFFDVFSFPLLRGDPQSALAEPFTVVITEEMAEKYFPGEDPIGKMLTVHGWFTNDYTVTGILDEPPDNSHLAFDFMASLVGEESIYSYLFGPEGRWQNNLFYTYVRLDEHAPAESLERDLTAFADRHLGAWAASRGFTPGFRFQPISDIHLRSDLRAELSPGGSLSFVYLFSAVALLILLIACANFVNLTTARSMRRAREVGVRKVLGADRGRLIGQFLSESILLTVSAFVLALVFVEITMPLVRQFSGQPIQASILDPAFLPILIGLILFIGVGAGSYPAFVLSAFRPSNVLRGHLSSFGSGALLRRSLVIFQFSISIVLMAATVLVYRQMQYVSHKPLGFDDEQVVVLPLLDGIMPEHLATFKNEVRRHSGVVHAAGASGVPGNLMFTDRFPIRPVGAGVEGQHQMYVMSIDPDLMDLLDFEVLNGRSFSDVLASDASEAFMLNEEAVRTLGWDDPVGRQIELVEGDGKAGTVIGVVRDFHFESLHRRIEPLAIHVNPHRFGCVVAKINSENVSETLRFIETQWTAHVPEEPFRYSFLDADFASQYAADKRVGGLFGVFAVLAITIACLGLFGLASYAAEQRTKEIGIRKVLGATVANLVALLSKDFLKLVLVAFAVAVPVAYGAMDRWLADFAYRIEISAWIFLMAGLAALLVALFTVSYQAIKAALADPVKSLRYE